MTSVWPLLLVMTGAVAALEIAFIFAARPRIALGAVMVVAVADTQTFDLTMHLGSLNLTPPDFVCFAIAVAVALRIALNRGRRPSAAVLWLLGIYVFALARGAQQFGLQAAVNEGRELFYFLVAAAYFSTVYVDVAFFSSLRRAFAAAAIYLTGVASLFWLVHGFGTYGAGGARALDAAAALLILEATLIAVVLPFGRGRARWLVPLAGFGVLLLSDQRTVWVAAVVAIAVLYVLSTRVGAHRMKRRLAGAVAIGVCALALLLASGTGGVDKSVNTAFGSSFSSESTLSWRVQGWEQLIERQIHKPIPVVALGNPAGTGFLRTIDGLTFNLAPHSEYVEIFLTAGLVGLAILAFAYGSLLRRLTRLARRAGTDRGIAALALSAMLVAEIVFFATYSIGISGGVIFGVALGLARARLTAEPRPDGRLSASRS